MTVGTKKMMALAIVDNNMSTIRYIPDFTDEQKQQEMARLENTMALIEGMDESGIVGDTYDEIETWAMEIIGGDSK